MDTIHALSDFNCIASQGTIPSRPAYSTIRKNDTRINTSSPANSHFKMLTRNLRGIIMSKLTVLLIDIFCFIFLAVMGTALVFWFVDELAK